MRTAWSAVEREGVVCRLQLQDQSSAVPGNLVTQYTEPFHPGDLPDLGIVSIASPALPGGLFTTALPEKPFLIYRNEKLSRVIRLL